MVFEMLEAAKHSPCALPSAIVSPKAAGYATRARLSNAITLWRQGGGLCPQSGMWPMTSCACIS